jgi:hypothetical protein
MVKKARVAEALLPTVEVHVSALLRASDDHHATTAWRVAALRDAEGIDEVCVEECGDSLKLRCGPFVLRAAGDPLGPVLPLALVYCFACLGANDHEAPEVTVDEAEACAVFLEGVKARRADASAVAVLEGALAAVDALLADVAPLSANHAAVHESAPNVLTANECAAVVAAADAHAAAQDGGGWQRTRHAAHATTDVAVGSVPALASWLPALVAARLLPQLRAKFESLPSGLFVEDLFVAKYDADASGGQVCDVREMPVCRARAETHRVIFQGVAQAAHSIFSQQ